MQFSHIYIKKLFGLYDYKINLFYDSEDKITILTGPNGYGKTTILTIINKLNPRELFYFYLLKFEYIEVGMTDGSCINIYQKYIEKEKEQKNTENGSDIKLDSEKEVRFEWMDSEKNIVSFFVYNTQNINKAQGKSLYQLYLFDSSDNDYNEKELINNRRFNEIIANSLKQDIFLMQLEGIKSDFIKANRIYNEINEKDKDLPIQRIKKSLQNILTSANKEFLEQSQRIEKKFINDILSCDNSIIEENQYTMAEISTLVGINDPHYFSRYFKKVYGITPTEYKRKVLTK